MFISISKPRGTKEINGFCSLSFLLIGFMMCFVGAFLIGVFKAMAVVLFVFGGLFSIVGLIWLIVAVVEDMVSMGFLGKKEKECGD